LCVASFHHWLSNDDSVGTEVNLQTPVQSEV
jgi:hypothetical protein